MPRQIGDSAFFETPDDVAKREKEKLEKEQKLNPKDHQFLSFVIGGQRMEVPLQPFIEKYGDPTNYPKEELIKYVMNTWMKKNLG